MYNIWLDLLQISTQSSIDFIHFHIVYLFSKLFISINVKNHSICFILVPKAENLLSVFL